MTRNCLAVVSRGAFLPSMTIPLRRLEPRPRSGSRVCKSSSIAMNRDLSDGQQR